MLGRLMKYEWKYIWKKFVLFMALLIGATIVGYFSCTRFEALDPDGPAAFGKVVSGMLGFMFYYSILIGELLGFSLIVAIRFYKTVYGGQSYLTHTLPVNARQIYGSHLIVYGLCMLAFTVLTQISIGIVSNELFTGVFGSLGASADVSMPFGPEFYSQVLGINSFASTLLVGGYICIASVSSLLMIYAAIVLGQKWKKHKVWGAVVSYLILSGIMTVIAWISLIPFMISMIVAQVNSTEPFRMTGFWGISLVYTVIFGIVYFFLMDHGMTKRLNLE